MLTESLEINKNIQSTLLFTVKNNSENNED